MPKQRKLLSLPDEARYGRRVSGFFDNFGVMPTKKTVRYFLANLAANADLATTIIHVFSQPVVIVGVAVTADGSVVGVDDSNTSTWTVASGGGTIVVEVFDATTTFPADNARKSLGALTGGSNNYIAAGGRLELTVLNGTTADLPPCVVDIEYYDTENYLPGWNLLPINGGTAIVADGINGPLALSPGSSNEDEIYLYRNIESLILDDGKPLMAEVLIQYAEQGTDDANVIFGLMSGIVANTMQDAGAGPLASYSGVTIFKVDGGTLWNCESSISTAQTTNETDEVPGSAIYTRMRIEVQTGKGTDKADIVFWINDLMTREDGAVRQDQRIIKHENVDISSASEMALVLGIKNGGSNAETLNIRYAQAWQNYED